MHVGEISEDFEIPWEHWDFAGRYYNPFLPRAHADKRGRVRQMTTGAVVTAVAAAEEGKQLRGGICRAYSNRRQIKSASVRRARCCGEIAPRQGASSPLRQSCTPRILDIMKTTPLNSVWRHRAHLGITAANKLLKAIAVSLGTERGKRRT